MSNDGSRKAFKYGKKEVEGSHGRNNRYCKMVL